MKTERLQELAGVQLDEAAPKTTKENPLVYVWDSAKSVDYPEQGLAGHMHLTTAAKIKGFSQKGLATLAKKLVDAGPGSDIGKGKRIKAFGVYLEYSQWNKEELKEAVSTDKRALADDTFRIMNSILNELERIDIRLNKKRLLIAMDKLGYVHEREILAKMVEEAINEFGDFMPGLDMMREEDE